MSLLSDAPWSPDLLRALDGLLAAPAPGQIAAFDFDNTCILRDAGECFFFHGLVAQMALRFDLDALWDLLHPDDAPDTLRALVRALLPLSPLQRRQHPDWPRYLGHMGGLYHRHCLRDGDATGFAWIVRLMIGLSPDQVSRRSADTLRRHLTAPLVARTWTDHTGHDFTVQQGLRPFAAIQDLVRALKAAGITPWIVSASNPWTVAAAAPLVGIDPAHVIGLTTAVRDGLLTADLDGPITYRQGKVDALDHHGLPRPALAVGDAWTDYELLRSARTAILLDKGDARLADEARAHGIFVEDRSRLAADQHATLHPHPRPRTMPGAEARAIDEAALAIWDGGLVALPTETVYGLGADALDPDAVARIFAAKGRPATNPLIVHVPDADAARALTSAWPPAAQQLADAFWPGPLTLVLPRAAHVPDITTAGADTIALRVPAHPVALALLNACGVPIAAPSANRSNHISPTRAEHVAASLGDAVDLILDAGPCAVGLESTIVSLVGQPTILRPGMISLDQLAQHLPDIRHKQGDAHGQAAPGQLRTHYAPTTPTSLIPASQAVTTGALLTFGPTPGVTHAEHGMILTLPDDPDGYARGLYDALHALDASGADHIAIHTPPAGERWGAAHDRLRRAAGGDR
jgi:L-threonylcarbamoyladenylate synthase